MADKKKILIVDDEPDIAKVTAFRLKKAGYEVLIATDGQMCLDMAASSMPGLIFLDLGLPVISGQDACKKLKTDHALKHIPVILLSASNENIKSISEEVMADGYMIKPYEPENLIATAKKYIV